MKQVKTETIHAWEEPAIGRHDSWGVCAEWYGKIKARWKELHDHYHEYYSTHN